MRVPTVICIGLLACVVGVEAVSSKAKPPSAYPRTLREVPPQFQGAWDTFGSRGCVREVSFRLEPRRFYNFEASYDVLKVVLRSPTLIVVHTRLDRVHGGPNYGTWTLKLVQGGTALSGPSGNPPYFERCQYGASPSDLLQNVANQQG